MDRSGCEVARAALKDLDDVGWRLFRPYLLTVTASAQIEVGDIATAKACLAEAHECTRGSDKRWAEAGVWRVEGDVLASGARLDDAQDCYRRAIEIARQQEAKSWELRASRSLARLWRDQGKRVEAYDRLAPIYGWFTEGFDTPDLKDTKAPLADL